MKASMHQQIDLIIKSFDYVANKMTQDRSVQLSAEKVFKVLEQDIERYKAAMRVLLRDEEMRLVLEQKKKAINKQEFLMAFREVQVVVDAGLAGLDSVVYRFVPQAKAA